jgi:hypothetical protein
MLALRAAEQRPGAWSRDAINYITAVVNNAYRAMSEADRQIGNAAFANVVLAIESPSVE